MLWIAKIFAGEHRCLAGLTLLTHTAGASIISFETAQGYSTTGGTTTGIQSGTADGALVGQPPAAAGVTSWLNTATGTQTFNDQLRVTADAGGNQVVSTANLNAAGPLVSHKLDENNNLGQTFSNTSSIVNFSYQLRLNGTVAPNTSGGSTLLRPRIYSSDSGGAELSDFEFHTNGEFIYTYNTTAVNGGTSSGAKIASKNGSLQTASNNANDFIATSGTFFTVSGAMNFASDTFTLFLNGTQQNAGTTMYFRNTPSNFSGLYFTLQGFGTGVGTDPTASIDNISVPEPASASLVMAAAGGFLLKRRSARALRV